jgi:uncharacterized membrane protein
MLAAGVIAGYGVIYANGILIVGAMAVSPDLLPITALCVAVALRRRRLLGHAAWTLVMGLGCAGLVACVLTVALDVLGLMPASFALGRSQILSGLTSVNSSTVMVALVAGVAGCSRSRRVRAPRSASPSRSPRSPHRPTSASPREWGRSTRPRVRRWSSS